MTAADNFVSHHLSQPPVENEVFALEFIVEIFFFYFISILYNSSFEMKNIIESETISLGTGSWDKGPVAKTAQQDTKIFIGADTDSEGTPHDYYVLASSNNYGGTTAYQVLLKNPSDKKSEAS